MNERIKQLAEQARKYAWENETHWSANAEREALFEQKFAELIVQECIVQCEEQYKPVLEDEAMMNEAHWKGYLHCGVDSVVAIREHFGVSE